MSLPTTTFVVREDGKNGTIEIQQGAIVRTIKKRIGKDDVLTIPIRSVAAVHHDRKTLGTDIVTVNSAGQKYSWKVSNAQPFVDALNAAIYA